MLKKEGETDSSIWMCYLITYTDPHPLVFRLSFYSFIFVVTLFERCFIVHKLDFHVQNSGHRCNEPRPTLEFCDIFRLKKGHFICYWSFGFGFFLLSNVEMLRKKRMCCIFTYRIFSLNTSFNYSRPIKPLGIKNSILITTKCKKCIKLR